MAKNGSKTRKNGKKVGRISPYDPDVYPKLAYDFALMGATNIGIAEALRISLRTLYKWQSEHEQFAQALKEGRKPADAVVVSSLFQRANGAVVLEPVKVKREWWEEVGGQIKKFSQEEVVMTERQYPPDTVACIFWLKNRMPEFWRDVKEHRHGGSIVHRLAAMSPDELEEVEAMSDTQIIGLLTSGEDS